jgi:N-acetylmuramoyl-L-alanine amidase
MSVDLPPPAVHVWPLPYEARLDQRPAGQIDLVVVHCTELPDMAIAREYGERQLHESGTGPTRIAHHTRGYNPRSIGIELVNIGRFPDWLDSRHQAMTEPYTEAQLHALVALLGSLRRELPGLEYIAGHEDLDTTMVAASDDPSRQVPRKRDPGPLFPWDRVLAEGELKRFTP